MPPRATTPPLGATTHALPREQPCPPPGVTTHAPPGVTTLPGSNHACPPVNRMTNRCKNITLPQTSFAGGKNELLWALVLDQEIRSSQSEFKKINLLETRLCKCRASTTWMTCCLVERTRDQKVPEIKSIPPKVFVLFFSQPNVVIMHNLWFIHTDCLRDEWVV